MSDLAKLQEWITRNRGSVETLLVAGGEILEALQPIAVSQQKTVQALLTDHPAIVRAHLDTANVAAIAGRHQMPISKIVEVLGVLLDLTKFVVAVL